MYKSSAVIFAVLLSATSVAAQSTSPRVAIQPPTVAVTTTMPISVEAANAAGSVVSGVNTDPSLGTSTTTHLWDYTGTIGPTGLHGKGTVGVFGEGPVAGGVFFSPDALALRALGYTTGVSAECEAVSCTAVVAKGAVLGGGIVGYGTYGVVGIAVPLPDVLSGHYKALAGLFSGDVSVAGGLSVSGDIQAPIIQQLQADNAALRSDIASLTTQIAALVALTGAPGIIPHTVPGRVQAEDYDVGGENVGYFDITPGNEGGTYRTDDVDIKTSAEGGYAVGWMMAGEWLAYTVNVPSDGLYTLSARVGSALPGRTFHVEVDGRDATGPIGVPQEADWDQYDTVSVAGVQLHAGRQTLRVVMGPDDYMDFQWFEVK